MFMIILRFGEHKALAPEHMAGHTRWIDDGFSAGAFQLVGSIVPPAGGVLFARGTRDEIDMRVARDPFVQHGVVTAEIIEVKVGRLADGLEALQ